MFFSLLFVATALLPPSRSPASSPVLQSLHPAPLLSSSSLPGISHFLFTVPKVAALFFVHNPTTLMLNGFDKKIRPVGIILSFLFCVFKIRYKIRKERKKMFRISRHYDDDERTAEGMKEHRRISRDGEEDGGLTE